MEAQASGGNGHLAPVVAVHSAEIAGIKEDIAELKATVEKRFDRRDGEIADIRRLLEKIRDRLEEDKHPCEAHSEQLRQHDRDLETLKREGRVIGVVNALAAAVAAALGVGGAGRP